MSKEKINKILQEMDKIAEGPFGFIPDLEHGYFYTAGNRITLFADENRWCFAFEKNGYSNRGSRIEIEINYFGNCLINLDRAGANDMYISNTKYFCLFDLDETICDENEMIKKDLKTITVRDSILNVEELLKDRTLDVAAFARLLDEHFPEIFKATEEELRTCIPKDLPQIMIIKEWFQPSTYGDLANKKLSEHETYQLIAKVLATRYTNEWKPPKNQIITGEIGQKLVVYKSITFQIKKLIMKLTTNFQ
jgi:hypothetical protein